MKVNHKLSAVITTLAVLTLLAIPNRAAPQGLTSLKATARGQGTLTVGKEVFKIHNVVINLASDGTGEITLVTDLTLFVNCTWSANSDLSKGIDLKITGGTTESGAQGSGKLLLKPDGNSIASLSLQGTSKTEKKQIEVNFVAE